MMSREQNFHTHSHLVCLYGATVKELRQTVSAYLKENRPFYFDNFGDHIAGYKIYVYSWMGKSFSLLPGTLVSKHSQRDGGIMGGDSSQGMQRLMRMSYQLHGRYKI